MLRRCLNGAARNLFSCCKVGSKGCGWVRPVQVALRVRTSCSLRRLLKWLAAIGCGPPCQRGFGSGRPSLDGNGRPIRISGNPYICPLEDRASQRSKRRMIHLADSLVCLHALSRGRSSSKRLTRTMSRINGLLLVSNSQCIWEYVHTHSNPADKPSRWRQRVRAKFWNAQAHS